MSDESGDSPGKIEVNCKVEPSDEVSSNNKRLSIKLQNNNSNTDKNAEPEQKLSKTMLDAGLNINLPRMNVPEKIIICLDLCADHDSTPFRFGDGSKQTPLALLKRVIQMFMFCKMTINPNHQYALMVLHEDGASWLVDFTANPVAITNALATLKGRDQPPECDLGKIFDVIADKVVLPLANESTNELPSHIVRVVNLYARTMCRPCLPSGCGNAVALMENPFFFLDLIYVHEPLNGEVKDICQSIFNDLCSSMSQPRSYVFNVGRNPTNLHDCMAKLLAHPLQRPNQQDAEYKLLLPE